MAAPGGTAGTAPAPDLGPGASDCESARGFLAAGPTDVSIFGWGQLNDGWPGARQRMHACRSGQSGRGHALELYMIQNSIFWKGLGGGGSAAVCGGNAGALNGGDGDGDG